MNEATIRKIFKEEINKSLEEFKRKNLSFRSWLRIDTPTDSFTASNKNSVDTSSFLSTSGGTINGNLRINGNIGFYNTTPTTKQTVTGSRGGNVALASLLSALATYGLVIDSST